MKLILSCLLLFAGQLQTPQSEGVIRLVPPHASNIPETARGQLVELERAPSDVFLPHPAPKRDPQGSVWYVDIKNLGPNDVSIEEVPPFLQTGPQVLVLLHPKDMARIRANGSTYVVVKRY
jgi:hypothetical protein